MSFDDFIKLYSGRPSIWDASLGVQCMALAHLYTYICLEITDTSVLKAPNAKSTWKLDYPQYFKKIKNDPKDQNQFPVKGDIMVWDGTDGHIAIVVDATGKDFNSFDANYPTGSYPHIQHHTYDNVLGWFHPIIKTKEQTLQELVDKYKKDSDALRSVKKQLDEKIKSYNELVGASDALQTKYDNLLKQVQANKPALEAFETKEIFLELIQRITGR